MTTSTRSLIQRLTTLLTPLLETENDRDHWLSIPLADHPTLRSHIDWSGTPIVFTQRLVTKLLTQWGAAGRQALCNLLEDLLTQKGADWEARIAPLREEVMSFQPRDHVVTKELKAALERLVSGTASEQVQSGPGGPVLSQAINRPWTDLAGRQDDIGFLEDLVARLEAGTGQVAGLMGEEGVGKTRLLRELSRSISSRGSRITYIEGRCRPDRRNIPYSPLKEVVWRSCGIQDRDSPLTITAKVYTFLRELRMSADEGAPFLLHLLGVKHGTEQIALYSSEAIKWKTFDTLTQMKVKSSQRRPLVVVVEDLQWVDKTSEEYFYYLASQIGGLTAHPILLLCTYRPEYRPPWASEPYYREKLINRLSQDDALEMFRSALQLLSARASYP